MTRFAAILPEMILALGGTVLMMLAAFTGRRGSTLISWLAVLLLLVATAALIGAPSKRTSAVEFRWPFEMKFVPEG